MADAILVGDAPLEMTAPTYPNAANLPKPIGDRPGLRAPTLGAPLDFGVRQLDDAFFLWIAFAPPAGFATGRN